MAFVTHSQQTNLFSTNQVHDNYVDAVRWVGNCLISKSTKNLICLWQPDASRYTHTYIYFAFTYIYKLIHTYIHTYIREYIHMQTHVYTHTYVHTYMHTHAHIYILIGTKEQH